MTLTHPYIIVSYIIFMCVCVLQNYNKFISATDTIRKMKCDVEVN